METAELFKTYASALRSLADALAANTGIAVGLETAEEGMDAARRFVENWTRAVENLAEIAS